MKNDIPMTMINNRVELRKDISKKIELRSNFVTAYPPMEYTAVEIRSIREKLNMSQGFFAEVIGVSKKTVESWEYGRSRPGGAAARMLTIADNDPEALRRYKFAEW